MRSSRRWAGIAGVFTSAMLLLVASTGVVRATSVPTVWVHYDYMVASDGRSEAPDPRVLQQVVTAFGAHGINLQIDSKHSAIPEHRVIVPDFARPGDTCGDPFDGVDEVSFLSLKATYFHPTANHDWHYAIFGYYADPCDDTGFAELPGNNFVIGLGGFRDQGAAPAVLERRRASTFMHELGHNLGLRHGGNVDANFKPNYLSVMNYTFIGGIPVAARPGSTDVVGFRLDYSDRVLPRLDESHLDETAGIGATGTDITAFDGEDGSALGPAVGPIDWNQNGHADETDVAVDLDYRCVPCQGSADAPPEYEVMTGFDDWTAVRAYLAGTWRPGPKTDTRDGVGLLTGN